MILVDKKQQQQQIKDIQLLYKHLLLQLNESKSWLLNVSGFMFDKEKAELLEDGYNTCIELEREDYNKTYEKFIYLIDDYLENINKISKKQYVFLNDLKDKGTYANKEMNSWLDMSIAIMAYKKSK